jgi:hypothetical protein
MSWLPAVIPQNLVPACRRLGKRGLRYHDERRAIGFADLHDMSLAEQRLRSTISQPLLMAVSAVLAQGPKLFIIPPDVIDDLNQVDIPLKVADYSQPFPAIIVKSNDEYHFCVAVERRPVIVTCNDGIVDYSGMMQLERSIESYLSDDRLVLEFPTRNGSVLKPDTADPAFLAHRFRGTINFILLLMAGGFQREPSRQYKMRRKHGGASKRLVPEIYKPQNIKLWQTRLIDANYPKGEGTGSGKTPHWRRAHWRRVAVGKGRVQRELRLMPAVLVNKNHLAVDMASTSYEVKD